MGIILRRVKEFPDSTSVVLNKMVIWVALPAVIFKQIPKLTFDSSILIPMITPWMIILVTSLIVYTCGKIFKIERKTLGALLLLIPLGNTSFLGFPMIEALRGPDSIIYAVIYDQLGSFFGLSVYGVLIVSIFAAGEKPTFLAVAKKAFLFPPFISMIAAFTLSRFMTWSPGFEKALSVVGGTLVPMAMIAVGFQLKIKLSKKSYTYLSLGLLTKLILSPLLVLLCYKLISLDSEAANVSFLESAMPPMITAGAVAIDSGLDEDLSAGMVGIGIFISFLTLPLLNNFI
ncbi:MAG: AEC family transporter [Bacteriovoracaceae bacterium]|nr:AEC family transporter [Bacteriovoracaceae bacterium]